MRKKEEERENMVFVITPQEHHLQPMATLHTLGTVQIC